MSYKYRTQSIQEAKHVTSILGTIIPWPRLWWAASPSSLLGAVLHVGGSSKSGLNPKPLLNTFGFRAPASVASSRHVALTALVAVLKR